MARESLPGLSSGELQDGPAKEPQEGPTEELQEYNEEELQDCSAEEPQERPMEELQDGPTEESQKRPKEELQKDPAEELQDGGNNVKDATQRQDEDEKTTVGKSLKITEQPKDFTKKLPPTLPPVITKICPAVEGGARPQVTHPPLTVLKLNPTDHLLACTQAETKVAARTKPDNQRRCFHKFPAARLTQDLPTSVSLLHPGSDRAPFLEPTSSPAQVPKLGRTSEK